MATDHPAADAGGPLPPTTVEEVIRHRLSAALGGWRGSLETALPTLAFVVAWVARNDLRTAVVSAVAVTVVLAVVRLAQRQSVKFVLQAVVPTVVAAVFALRSGRAEDAFLPGILWNVVMGVVAVLSVATRWPLVGFMVAAGDPDLAEDPLGWRRDHGLVRVCQRLTLVLVAIFAIRLALMLPLYLAGAVAALGVAKIVLGWPLWLGALAVMGVLLVRGHTPQELEPAPTGVHEPHRAAERGPATDTESPAR
ncbi:DUF3159 domain-containing protein [Pedococcus sp. NPDC057267]|uniref:DUF3159 domain-containing protein n=1 Tax=Pedococcus sp. NPDC057267 TaxID=3346077 RepID=UPI003641B5BB